MSLYYITILSAYTITLPLAAALIRIKRIREKYMPILILLSVGLTNEIISTITAAYFSSNAINGNIYVLIEYFLIVWQFKRLSGYLSNKALLIIVSIGLVVWIVDNMLLHTIRQNNSIFRMVYSLFIVYLSMDKANQLILFNSPFFLKNADLLICVAFFIYFAFKAFGELFNIIEMPVNRSFYYELWTILSIVNMLTNILLTIAVLCIPRKQEYIIPSSQGLAA